MPKNDPLWVREFGWEWKIPARILDDRELVDMSWHNDSAPSFYWNGRKATDEMDVRLFVEHPDQALRDTDHTPRFVVVDTATEATLYSGGDVRKAIKALKAGA